MSAARVRPVRPADLPRVWELIGELAAYEKLEALMTGSAAQLGEALFGARPAIEGLVAEADGRIVGYALFYPTFSSMRTNPRLWLEDLYVEPAARGAGAGRALLAAFARVALARGCHRVDWAVLEWNPARRFYERAGAGPSADGMLQYGLSGGALAALAREAGA
ncbi:MAG TPA: GNAT family N-acetyltransferase [Candidatus Eisenbacteria bacterium]|nr:GNAT family N-acetyltransferase [Candidatus Eisenbacteria bacterium]